MRERTEEFIVSQDVAPLIISIQIESCLLGHHGVPMMEIRWHRYLQPHAYCIVVQRQNYVCRNAQYIEPALVMLNAVTRKPTKCVHDTPIRNVRRSKRKARHRVILLPPAHDSTEYERWNAAKYVTTNRTCTCLNQVMVSQRVSTTLLLRDRQDYNCC